MIAAEIREAILEAMPPYPTDNRNEDIEKGYHEAVDNLIKVLDSLSK